MKLITNPLDLFDYLFTIPKVYRDTPLEVAFELMARILLEKGFDIKVKHNRKNELFIYKYRAQNGWNGGKWSKGAWITAPLPSQHKKNQKELRKMIG